jgi:hypothetical protein
LLRLTKAYSTISLLENLIWWDSPFKNVKIPGSREVNTSNTYSSGLDMYIEGNVYFRIYPGLASTQAWTVPISSQSPGLASTQV